MRFTGQNKKNIDPRYFHNELLKEAASTVDAGETVFTIKQPKTLEEKIMYLQEMLSLVGAYQGEIDGLIGPLTVQAIAKVGASQVKYDPTLKKALYKLNPEKITRDIDGYIAMAKDAKKEAYAKFQKGSEAEKQALAGPEKPEPKTATKSEKKPIPPTPPATQQNKMMPKANYNPKEGDEMIGELGPVIFHNGKWIPKSEYEQLKKGLEEAKSRDNSYNRIKEEKNKKLFEALVKG